MKFFVAQLLTETNTFTSAPTGWAGYEEYGIFYGDASARDPQGFGAYLAGVRAAIEGDGHEMSESLCAFAQPYGRTVAEVYDQLSARILQDLEQALPVDGVILLLHGAMVAEGLDDCEGDLQRRVRELVGSDVPVGVELDLHCHFTQEMQRTADVTIAYKEYPHTDAVARARELYSIVRDTALGKVRPTTAVFDCRMVGVWHTTREPMSGFVRHMQSFEGRDGVLSVSLGHGFPWGDVPESGAKLWVVTDNDPAGAQALAERLGREFWDLREATRPPVVEVDVALDSVLAMRQGTAVLADVADNAGGGAPGDSTFILRRMLERGIGNAAVGMFWDLGAIHICREAGVGAVMDLRLGGKCGPASGDPLDLRVTVKQVLPVHSQVGLTGREPLSCSVWLRTSGGIDIALASVRSQVFGRDAFTGLGITLEDKRLVVVKSMQHFHAQFAPIAAQVLYVSTPGALRHDFESIPYTVRDLNYWPRKPDPHATSAA